MTKARIIVVEDEGIIAQDIAWRLKDMGYDVPAVISSGEAAVKTVGESRPDLVLMDIMLPGSMDGIEAADKIRKDFSVPVIYVTAYNDEDILERAKISEPFGYILKPINEKELHSAIEIALYKHKTEGELHKYRCHLEELVRERTSELQTEIAERKKAEKALQSFTEQLKKSNRELEQFAYIASHDLQEPLRKVMAFGDRLKSKFCGVLGDEGMDYLERMRSASKRMKALVSDLLTLSRITTKAQPFVRTELSDIIRDVLSDLEVSIERTKGRVRVDDLPAIEADPLQMRQLLQNIIGNALKFNKKDEPPVVNVRGLIIRRDGPAGEDDRCEVTIEDNGVGFEEKYAERIFEAFQRLHGMNEYEGAGIGLSVCKKIVERHRGSIRAKSRPGVGTRFIVTLPVKQSAAEPG